MNGDSVEFERLLHNYDYDTREFINTVEKEHELIEELNKDIEMTKISTTQLQECLSGVDKSVMRVHKQYTINRDSCNSLKCTSTFLTQHFTTLTKKLETFMSTYKQDESENEKILDHYWNIWKDYDVKYQTLPFVKRLENKVTEFSVEETHLFEKKQEKEKLVTNISGLKGSRQLNDQELQKFIVDVSQLKINSITKRKNISLLKTEIQQKHIEKHEASRTITVDSSLKEAELNKENVQPNVCLVPEEPPIAERMNAQCQDKMRNESLKISSTFKSKINVPLQLGNSSEIRGENSLTSKTSEKTHNQSLYPDNLFKQPGGNYAKNQRNDAFNAKISLPPALSIINTVAPESRMVPTTRTSISETVVTLPAAVARSTERTNFTMPSLHPPLMQNIMFNQFSSGNFNQLNKHESEHRIMAEPSLSVHNSANVQVAQPVSHAANQMPKVVTTSLQFSAAAIQPPLTASDCNFNFSPITTSSKQSPLSTSQEITPPPPVNNKGTFHRVPLDAEEKSFDFNEHQLFMKKFHSSPGAPSYSQRPMFQLTEEKTNVEEADENKKVDNPFFLQSFFSEQNDIPQNKETQDSFKSPGAAVLSPFTDHFSGFNQSSGNETTGCSLNFDFNNSLGETSTTENNFFSFNSNAGFSQAEDSTSSFSFNFDSTTNSDNDNTTFSLF